MESYLYKRAVIREDKERARDLITEEYLRAGYIAQGSSESDLSRNLFLDTTVTFLAFKGEDAVGTLSILTDEEGKLPMESDWAEEVAVLRKKGKRIAEVGQFAVRHDTRDGQTSLALGPSLGLFKRVLEHGLTSPLDSFCICVHAKHERFYTALGFVSIGALRRYGVVGVEFSAGMELDLNVVRAGRGNMRDSSMLARLLGMQETKNYA